MKNPERLFANPSVVKRAARANILALHYLPAAVRELYLSLHPEERTRYLALAEPLRDLGIEHFSRLGPPEVARALIENRTQPRAEDDTRPTAVFIWPKEDHNGAFGTSDIANMNESYRVLYYEAGTDEDVREILAELEARGEKAAFMSVGGHGAQGKLALGGADPGLVDTQDEQESFYLDYHDRDQLKALGTVIAEGAHLVLASCSTAKGRSENMNLAGFLSRLAPHAHVWAPVQPTNNRLQLDEGGRFVSPGYRGGRAETHHIPPRSSGVSP